MPTILTGDGIAAWLASATVEVLKPADDGLLVAQAVNPVLNSPRVDDPGCLEPAELPEAALFG